MGSKENDELRAVWKGALRSEDLLGAVFALVLWAKLATGKVPVAITLQDESHASVHLLSTSMSAVDFVS